MKFVIDEQLPARLAHLLRDLGHEAVHVDEIGMRGAADRLVWSYAVANRATLVSKDEDFIDLQRALSGSSLVRLRIGNCTNAILLERVRNVWPKIVARLSDGEQQVEVR